MTPTVIAGAVLGGLLLASMAGNAWLFSEVGDAREAAGQAENARVNASEAAKACDRGVADLQTKVLQQAADAADAIEAARAEGLEAGRRAQAERTRPQAVPGKVCESAAAETGDWLKRRQAAPK